MSFDDVPHTQPRREAHSLDCDRNLSTRDTGETDATVSIRAILLRDRFCLASAPEPVNEQLAFIDPSAHDGAFDGSVANPEYSAIESAASRWELDAHIHVATRTPCHASQGRRSLAGGACTNVAA